MRIGRSIKALESCMSYGGIFEIELTREEISHAYKLQKREDVAQDIADSLYEKLVEFGVRPEYAEALSRHKSMSLVDEVIDKIDKLFYLNVLYNEVINSETDTLIKIMYEDGVLEEVKTC